MGGTQSVNRHGKLRPDTEGPIIFDQLKGFPDGRKEKVMHVTDTEMECAKVPLKHRDYCAHTYIDLKTCIRKNFPLNYRCSHAKHIYHDCVYDEEIMRFKEYERERRLMERHAKKERKTRKMEELEGLGQ